MSNMHNGNSKLADGGARSWTRDNLKLAARSAARSPRWRPLSAAWSLVGATVAASTLAVGAGESPTPAPLPSIPFQKPSWLSDLAFSVKEGYDDNVFASGTGPSKNRESWVTTFSPKFGVDFAALAGRPAALSALSLGYSPDFNFYHQETSEDFDAHRIAATLKGKTGDFSYSVENGFNYIDGSENGPIYLAGRSAYGSAVPRERREQFQDRAKAIFQYDLGRWFIRPNATFLYYDLRTNMRVPTGPWTGYDNYPDRYDVNGGADLGLRVSPSCSLTLGYRYGHQYQQQFAPAIDPLKFSASSDYQRVLVGVEAKPWKWLTISGQAGPDFRNYQANTPTHTTPIKDPDLITYYAEAGLTAELSRQDTLSFKYKQWQWVSSIGKLPYFDSLYDLSYRHKFNQRLTADLTGRAQTSDYTSGSAASSVRYDCQYTVAAGITFAFTGNLTASLNYNLDLARNAQDGLSSAVEAQREFNRQMVSLGLQFKF